jgi:hypothetical protein
MAHSQYVDKADVKTWLGLSGTGQDANIDIAINAACRAIDDFVGREFIQSEAVEDRFYDCEFAD